MGRTRGPQGFTLMENDHGRKGGACSRGLGRGAQMLLQDPDQGIVRRGGGDPERGRCQRTDARREDGQERPGQAESQMGECGGKRVLP